MPRGVYPRKTAQPAKTESSKTESNPDAPDNVLHPVEGNPAACPAPLCPECLPDGWPEGAEQCVGCTHGMWIRQWPPQQASTPTIDF